MTQGLHAAAALMLTSANNIIIIITIDMFVAFMVEASRVRVVVVVDTNEPASE